MVRCSLLVLCLFTVGACNPDNQGAPGGADNTGVNTGDPNDAKSAFDQNENEKDIQITADIRKRIVDAEMSISAQNVEIVTQKGQVTLEGSVADADEKQKIEAIANDVAGADHVDSKLEVNVDR